MRQKLIEETLCISRENDHVSALTLQRELANYLDKTDSFPEINLIAGVDLAYKDDMAVAVIALFNAENLSLVEESVVTIPVDFPYISGLLTYREFPALYQAFLKLERKPDIMLFDGQGMAHPRRMGIAAHAGILLDIPSIGVAKSRLTGDFDVPGPQRFDSSPLFLKSELIGYVLRSREGCKPIFISSGYKVSPDSALQIVKDCIRDTKLPVPTHYADRRSKTLKK